MQEIATEPPPSSNRVAPLTARHLPVGDGHELYVESVGRADGIAAVYLHGGPGSGCQAAHRLLFDPARFHAVLFDQRGAGRSRPRAARKANTTAHLIADLELIRAEFGFERWLVVGGSWGATLALAYAQAHPARVSGLVLRATFLGTREELDRAFRQTLPQFYPALHEDFLGLLGEEERAAPLDAYWRRILDPDPTIHGPAARAWHDTERTLTEHNPGRTRLDLAALTASPRAAADAGAGSALFPARLLPAARAVAGGSRSPQRHSRHHRAGPLRPAVPADDRACAGPALARRRSANRRCRGPLAVRPRRARGRHPGDQRSQRAAHH